MTTKQAYIAIFLIVAGALVAGVYTYPLLPERMASHWDAAGAVNGYMGKFWGVTFVPILLLALSVLFLVLPTIDPLRENIGHFRKDYNLLVVSILLFVLFVYALTLLWNLGVSFDLSSFVSVGIGLLFIIIGRVLPRTRRNWFMGIRTPWTLSSDEVWERTHHVAGCVFQIVGVITIVIGIVFPESSLIPMLIIIIGAAVWSVIYSYVLYRRTGQLTNK